MGRKFLTLLEEILAVVKDANGLFYGNPLPLVTSDMVPVKGQILSIEQKLEEMIIDTTLDQLETLAAKLLKGEVRGRVVVNIN